jgi:hypothetical protein
MSIGFGFRRAWLGLHRDKERVRASLFGTFDGATSSYGVTFAMFVQHRPPVEFVAPVIGLAIASAAGMGGGAAESAERANMVGPALVMGLTSFFGVVVVALAFFFLHGLAALTVSLLLAISLGVAIAERRREDLGRRFSYFLTFGVLAVAIGVTSALAVVLPGSGG